MSLEISTFPGETFDGTVAFIDPIVDPRTRTAQIRVEVNNTDRRLSRGMFADAVIHRAQAAATKPPLVIPRSAPLFTGKRSLVYVEVPGRSIPTYAAREVRLGAATGNSYPVLSGLSESDRVVVQGAFALDAELQIRGGQSMMAMLGENGRAVVEPIAVNASFRRGFAQVVDVYLGLQSALAKDNLASSKSAYGELAAATAAFSPTTPQRARAAWLSLAATLNAQTKRGAAAADLDEARRTFEPVSIAMTLAIQQLGNPLDQPLRVAACPMAIDKRTARWLQLSDKVENPFRGMRMQHCGSIESEVPVHEGSPAAAPTGVQR